MSSWRKCSGPWVRFVAWLCRRNAPGVKAYAAEKIRAEIDEANLQAVLIETFKSGKSVFATVDDDGNLHMEHGE